MKLNNRGVTLMELIVSVALISIVIMFLFRLLVDVRYNNNNNDFNRENQQNRAVIVNTIQKEFIEKKLVDISADASASTDDYLKIIFTYGNGDEGTLSFNNNKEDKKPFVMYENKTGFIEKWYLQKENEDTMFNLNCVKYEERFDTGEYYSIRFRIPVVVNKNRQNALDDIEFSYVGEKKDLDFGTTSFISDNGLGNYAEDHC